METWMSWALFLALAGAGYLYYSQKQRGVARGRSTTTRSTTASSAADTAQWLDTEVKAKASKVAKSAKAKVPRKQAKNIVQETGSKVEAYLSGASSNAGADADDDLSPVASPSFSASKAPSGRDVSDMLGSQPSAPSVLSIKPVEKPARPVKSQIAKTETPSESKKARQNRRKAEEAKAAREEEEKHRQALLEKQRRAAREARGEPARNGLQPAKAPSSNAWSTARSAGAVQTPVSATTSQLLDTFDAASTTSSSEAPTNGTIPTPDSLSNSGYNNAALSEEEQVKLALEDTTAWETVPKGKKQKKKVVDDDGDVATPQAAQPVKPVQIDKFIRPSIAENKKPSSRYQILQEEFTGGTDNADDWPVV